MDACRVCYTGKQSQLQIHNRCMHSATVADTVTHRYAQCVACTQVHAQCVSCWRTHSQHTELHTALLRHVSSYTHDHSHEVIHTSPHTNPHPWTHTPLSTYPLRQVAPSMVVAQVTLASHSHQPQKMPRCPLAVLWPAAHSPACLIAPSSLGWEWLWDGQKSPQAADGAKESQWCVMPCSSPGPAGSNREGHLRIQGECSLFWGQQEPPTLRSRPPALPGEGASRPWVDSHPFLVFW